MKTSLGSNHFPLKIFSLIFPIALILISCQSTSAEYLTPLLTPGETTENQDTYGQYYLYTPTTPSNPPQSLLVIQGTPAKDLTAGETAFYYAEH